MLKYLPLSVLFLSLSAFGEEGDYIDQALCEGCHRSTSEHWSHTVHARIFSAGPRNELEARGCQACHGPGADHLLEPTRSGSIIGFAQRSQTPVADQNQVCAGCHAGGDRLHWDGSMHESSGVACSDCHNPMAEFSSQGLLSRESINETCFSCHQSQRGEFRRRSHMPLLEGKLSCLDCHNPHGSATDPLLKTDTLNETCYQCHAEKRGPFLWEHAPVQEDCALCHLPHGSNHEKLLVTARPVLCQQCHSAIGHVNELITRGNLASGPGRDPRGIGRSCSNCHVQVHGSNHPSGARLQR
ncbi:MAG: DmsE family decaheme c-type cytochrome [Xanthomonadales bacterium]|nr:DmsE family decaheme c-type cytochrome [Xanthomonadales bacterium]